MPPRAVQLALPAAIILAAINLRPALAGIGPLLDAIQDTTGMSDAAAGLLTSVPVALMGVCMLGAGTLCARLGGRTGVALGLGVIALACILRWIFPDAGVLLASAFAAGLGIALVQALIPGTIRTRAGERSSRLMAIYSTAIMGGAMVASGGSPYLAKLLGWPGALGIWSFAALGALFVWVQLVAPEKKPATVEQPVALYRSARAWLLLALFGLGTGAYTLVLAWLPPFYTRLGWSADASGALLGFVTFAEVVAGLFVSRWIERFPDRRGPLFTATAALLVGLLLLILAPIKLAWPAALLLGMGIGALFPLSLIVAMDHGKSAFMAARIANFVQGGGYLIAALLPFAAGVLRTRLDNLTPAWGLMAGLAVILFVIAARLRPGETISTRSTQEQSHELFSGR